ncbi:translation initiation factor IF-2-like [Corvus cornix cornix]|uniref:translation initiation factor IF-2-like n=1 Tax=Corvus cornix cornix TaxID=932674 RepID=UPI001950292E|nr:translation initiation factor IF-2-like [Corvus cornix cornix]
MQPPPRTRRPRPASRPARPVPAAGSARRGRSGLRAAAGAAIRSVPGAAAPLLSVHGCRGCDPLRARLPRLRSALCPAAGAPLRSVPGRRGSAPLRARLRGPRRRLPRRMPREAERPARGSRRGHRPRLLEMLLTAPHLPA